MLSLGISDDQRDIGRQLTSVLLVECFDAV